MLQNLKNFCQDYITFFSNIREHSDSIARFMDADFEIA